MFKSVLPKPLIVFVCWVNAPAESIDLIFVKLSFVHPLLWYTEAAYPFFLSFGINLAVILFIICDFISLNYTQMNVNSYAIFLNKGIQRERANLLPSHSHLFVCICRWGGIQNRKQRLYVFRVSIITCFTTSSHNFI